MFHPRLETSNEIDNVKLFNGEGAHFLCFQGHISTVRSRDQVGISLEISTSANF